MMSDEYYQSGKLIERIDWDKIMPLARCAGGHDDQMKCLLKDVILLAHYNSGDYQGQIGTCVILIDTGEIVLYTDYYGSCSGCDAWEGASDEQAKSMCIQLAGGAYIFKDLVTCEEYLKGRAGLEYSDVAAGILREMDLALQGCPDKQSDTLLKFFGVKAI